MEMVILIHWRIKQNNSSTYILSSKKKKQKKEKQTFVRCVKLHLPHVCSFTRKQSNDITSLISLITISLIIQTKQNRDKRRIVASV